MRISSSFLNDIDEPVGNSPGPDITLSVTSGESVISLPEESRTTTVSCTSSVPSAAIFFTLLACRASLYGTLSTGHCERAISTYSFLSQYQALLGKRK